MLTLENIQDIIDRVRIQDTNFVIISRDAYGDFLVAYDSTLSFVNLKSKILANSYYSDRIVDNGYNFLEIHDNVYVNGDKVKIAILVEDSDRGHGTNIKLMVKNVSHEVDGDIKLFLSFESMKNYINRVSVSTEV